MLRSASTAAEEQSRLIPLPRHYESGTAKRPQSEAMGSWGAY